MTIDIGSAANARATTGARLHDAREALHRARAEDRPGLQQRVEDAEHDYRNAIVAERLAYRLDPRGLRCPEIELGTPIA